MLVFDRSSLVLSGGVGVLSVQYFVNGSLAVPGVFHAYRLVGSSKVEVPVEFVSLGVYRVPLNVSGLGLSSGFLVVGFDGVVRTVPWSVPSAVGVSGGEIGRASCRARV